MQFKKKYLHAKYPKSSFFKMYILFFLVLVLSFHREKSFVIVFGNKLKKKAMKYSFY